MTTVINLPHSLDEQSFEQVLEQVAPLPADAKMILDARHTKWASPYGLSALLTLGQTRNGSAGGARLTLAVPEADDTVSYWSRANFFYYDMRDAQRSYEANLNIISATRRMIQRTLDILKS